MIEETTRQLTADERSILDSLGRPSSSGGAGFGALLTFIVTLGTLLIVLPDSWQYGVRSLAPAAVALPLAVAVFVRLRRSQRRSAWYQQIARDLDSGVAKVTTFHAVDAICVEEFEDEGSQYYLRLEDGQVVFLAGQYLYEPEEEGRFPNTVITVVRAPTNGTVLDLKCTGKPLEITARRSPFSVSDHRDGRVPEDGAVLDIDFEALRSDAKTP